MGPNEVGTANERSVQTPLGRDDQFEASAREARGCDGLGIDRKRLWSPFCEHNGTTGVVPPIGGRAALFAACLRLLRRGDREHLDGESLRPVLHG